jgi:hypothetical protein
VGEVTHGGGVAALVFAAGICTGCGGGGGGGEAAAQAAAAVVRQSPTVPQKLFVDVTASSGIAYEIGYRNYLPLNGFAELVANSATGGVAAGDYDSDGDIDLFITRGDIGPNLLYRNDGHGTFEDVALTAGLAYTATPTENYRLSGPTFADMDGDGDLDLFIGGLFGDPSFVYRNQGDGSFVNVTSGSGLDGMSADYNVSAAFGDYDLDGDLDLFVAHWGTFRDPQNPGDTEHLWRNDSHDGVIVFSSVSESAGIAQEIMHLGDPDPSRAFTDYTFTPAFARIDNDLYPDILSVGDFNSTKVFVNNHDGSFRNATDPFVLSDENGMGSAVGDFDNDGDLDWFVTSISSEVKSGNRFYENRNGVFVDRTSALGVSDGSWGWGACFMDFENDGDLDLYHTNGWALEGHFLNDRSRAFVGTGGGRFTESAASLGLDDTDQGRGVVCADFDNDGDVDIFQLHRGTPVAATMWRNEANGRNFIRIQLKGRSPNTEAAGARIYLTIGTVTQMREIVIGSNFVSQNPTIQVMGLDTATQVDEIRVQWPDGAESVERNVAAGRTLLISQAGA